MLCNRRPGSSAPRFVRSSFSGETVILWLKISMENVWNRFIPIYDERTKRGAEEPGLLLHNMMLMILYLSNNLTLWTFKFVSFLPLKPSNCFSIDKALNSLGYKFGYALPKPQLPNPINIVMVHAQKVW